MKNDFNLCPKCGSEKIINHKNKKWTCDSCGFELYCNVAAAVGVVIIDEQNKVLLETRAKEPKKGFLALPGGFIDADECAEEAARRECIEETGVCVDEIEFLCTRPNTYEYKNIEYKTCDMFFLAHLPKTYKNMQDYISTLHAQESEVAGFSAWKVETKEDVDKIPLAFDSARQTLYKLVEKMEKLK